MAREIEANASHGNKPGPDRHDRPLVGEAVGNLLAGILLAFLIGEGPPNPLALTWKERLLFLSLITVLVGFVVLWLRELPGGLLVTGGMIAFYVINYLASGRFPSGWVFPMFFAPGILSLVSWKLARHRC